MIKKKKWLSDFDKLCMDGCYYNLLYLFFYLRYVYDCYLRCVFVI